MIRSVHRAEKRTGNSGYVPLPSWDCYRLWCRAIDIAMFVISVLLVQKSIKRTERLDGKLIVFSNLLRLPERVASGQEEICSIFMDAIVKSDACYPEQGGGGELHASEVGEAGDR